MEEEEQEEDVCEINDEILKKKDMSKIQYSIHTDAIFSLDFYDTVIITGSCDDTGNILKL
jgi:hypothetical protein